MSPKLGSHFTKRLNFNPVCIFCNERFLAADVKAQICSDCKIKKHYCACGCKEYVIGANKRYIIGHAANDLKNKQIELGHLAQAYKVLGKNNPSKRLDVRKKISLAVKESWGNELIRLKHLRSMSNRKFVPCPKRYPYGSSTFRSPLELAFAKWCRRKHLHYRYEVKRFLLAELSTTYCPDFYLIDHKLFVEIKGDYWFGKNQEGLIKPRALAKFCSKEICVLLPKHLIELGVLTRVSL